MSSRFFYSLHIVFSLLCLTSIPVLGEVDKAERILEDFLMRIETAPIDATQVRGIKKLAESNDASVSTRATALLAKYICECENRPDEALLKVAPFVLGSEKYAEFAKVDNTNSEKTFPLAATWQLECPECCVAAAGILAYQKKYPEALAGLNHVGGKLSGIPRALAAEGVGDILFEIKQFQNSVDAFTLGLNVLNELMKSPGFHPDATIDFICRRMQGKLSKAELALDSERYGPEFVAYRETRKLEFSGNSLRAAAYFDRIIKNFPGTIYFEAARLYRPKNLFQIADKSVAEKVKSEIAAMEAQVQKNQAMLKKDSDKMSKRIVDAFEKQLEEDKILLNELSFIPAGEKAAELAAAELERFISENEFGPYRGEALLLLADYNLERELDPEKALKAYDRAAKWIEEAKKAKAEIDKFQVPLKALKVTLPPQTMHSHDIWGNMEWSKLEPGNVINQFTCPWYFDWLELGVLSKRGLCNFILGNKAQALEDIKVIVRNSPEERKLFQQGRYNSYSRLKSEFTLDRMFATKEELDQFKGKSRIAVMVADYYYEIEDWKKAFQLYTLYREIFGKRFNKKANAYFDYLIGNLYMIMRQEDKGLPLLEKFDGKLYEDTPTWPRAMCALFSHYQTMEGKHDYALSLLRRIQKKMPDNETGQKAYYDQAEYLYALERYDEAIPIFDDVIKKYPSTWMADGANEYLEKIKIKRSKENK